MFHQLWSYWSDVGEVEELSEGTDHAESAGIST